uniref:EVE domain-containing protein n=1 Tax=Macrostomum lignano TaxID=282301 RepID=A0A1I8FEN5_9PLAT
RWASWTKFVQVGRVAFIANGADSGKVCAIAEIVDAEPRAYRRPLHRRAPAGGDMKRLHLTGFHLPLPALFPHRVIRNRIVSVAMGSPAQNQQS